MHSFYREVRKAAAVLGITEEHVQLQTAFALQRGSNNDPKGSGNQNHMDRLLPTQHSLYDILQVVVLRQMYLQTI